MKYLYVTFPDATYRIPAEVIAKDRAAYYATHDTSETTPHDDPEWQRIYAEELEYALSNEYEIIDWASNNTDWDNVKRHAEIVIVDRTAFDYCAEWTNAPKEVKG